MKNIKRIAALLTVILIVGFIIATLVIAFLDFPNKQTVFLSCMAGVIILPIIAWIFLWIIGVLTNRKNIASFRSEEMEETMRQADEIRFRREQEAAASNDTENQ